MTTVATLNAKVGLDTGDAERGAGRAHGILSTLAGSLKSVVSAPLQSMGNLVSSLGAIGLAANGLKTIVGGIVGVAQSMVSGNAEFERYETQFGVLLGSTKAAKDRLAELAEFGAKTPFELPELVRADKILISFGLDAADTQKRFGISAAQIRTTIGDVASGTGTSFEELSSAFGRFASGSTGEAIMRFQELGIATREQMASWGMEFAKSGQLLTPTTQAFAILEKNVRAKFGGMMTAQSSTFEGMLSNVSDWMGATKRKLMAPLFEVLKDKMGGFLTFLGSPAVMGALDGVANALANGIGGAMTWIGDKVAQVQPIIAAFTGAFQETGGGFEGVMSGIVGVIGQLFPQIDLMKTVIPVVDQITNVFLGLRGVFIDLLAGADIGVLGDDIREAFGFDIMPLVAGIQQVASVIQANLMPIAAGLGAMVVTVVVPAFIAWAASAVAAAAAAATAAAATVIAMAPVILPILAIGAAVGLLAAAWQNNWGGIQEKTAAVVGWLQTAFADVQAWIQTAWQNVTAWTTTAWSAVQSIIEGATQFIGSILAAFQSAREGDWYAFGENLRAAWDVLWGAISGILENAASILGDLMGTLWGNIQSGAETAKGALIASVTDMAQGMWDSLTTTDWLAVGTNIVQGIIQGLQAQIAAARQAATNVAKAIYDAIRGFLGIKSPSTVFMQIGMDTMMGLVAGLTEGEVEVLNRSTSIVQNIFGIFGQLTQALQSAGAATTGPMPNLALWVQRFEETVRIVVNAIVALAGPGTDFAWALGQAAGAAQQIGSVIGLLSSSIFPEIPKVLPDLTVWAEQFQRGVIAVVNAVNAVVSTTTPEVIAQAAGLAEAIGKIMTLVSVNLRQMATATELPDLDLWAAQVTAVFAKIREVVRDIVLQPAIEMTGGRFPETVEAIVRIMALTSVDLGRMATVTLPNLDMWRTQMTSVFQVIREVVRDIVAQPAIEGTGGRFPETVEAIVRIMNLISVDLSRMGIGKLPNLDVWRAQMVDVMAAIRLVVRDILAQDNVQIVRGDEFVAAIQKFVSIFALASVDLSRLAVQKLPNLDLWRDQMVNVMQSIREVVRDILAQDNIQGVRGDEFVSAVQKIVSIFDLVSVDLSKMAIASELPQLGTWAGQIGLVFNAIKGIVAYVMNAITDDELETLGERVGRITSVLGLVGMDLSKMVIAKELPNLGTWAGQIAQVFTAIRYIVLYIMNTVTDDELGTLATRVGHIAAALGMVKGAVDALTALATYRTTALARLSQFAADLASLIREFAEHIGNWLTPAVAEAYGKVGAAIGSLMGGLKAGLDLLVGLRYYVRPTQLSIDNFSDGLKTIVTSFNIWIQSTMTADQIKTVGTFSESMKSLFEGLSAALSFANALGSSSFPGLAIFEGNLQAFNTILRTMMRFWAKELLGTITQEQLDAIATVSGVVQDMVSGMNDCLDLIKSVSDARMPTPGKLKDFIDAIGAIFTSLATQITGMGDILRGASPGITSALQDLIRDLTLVTGWYDVGRSYAQQIADGMRAGLSDIRDAAGGGVRLPPGGNTFGFAGASGGGININVTGTFQVREEADIRKISQELMRLAQRQGVRY